MASLHADIHADLAASVRTYAEREGGLARVRTLRDSSTGFDRARWARVASLGWLGLRAPEDRGGAGLGAAEVSVLAREFGRALVPEPFSAVGVLAVSILTAGPGDGCCSLLAAVVEGRVVPAVAWQEVLGVLDARATLTHARASGATTLLRGTKQWVVNGASADGFIVSARSEAGCGLYWLERDRPGVVYRPARRADGSEHGTLQLEDLQVDAGDCLVAPADGANVLAAAIDETVLAISAELLGVAERALDITLEYLRTRVQFGKPIGSFQALQHRCVDLFILKELGVSAMMAALAEWSDATPPRRSALASRVKARCADAALEICRRSIQMHGAMGFTDGCDIGLYLKRALVLVAWLGNAQFHRRRYAHFASLAHCSDERTGEAA